MSNRITDAYDGILELESKIKIYEEKLKSLKERKKKYENYLFNEIKTKVDSKNQYVVNSKKIIKVNTVKKYEVLSQKFLKNNLVKFFFSKNDKNYKDSAEQLLKFLLKIRQNQVSYVIKCKNK